MSSLWLGTALLACAGQLGLALFALRRGGRGPLAVPLALLCLDLFAWHTADLAHRLTGSPAADWLDHALSPLTAPLSLEFVLAFTGERRRMRAVRALAWTALGALSLASAAAFVLPGARDFPGSQTWAALHLAAALPAMGFAVAILLRHLRHAGTDEERARTRLLLVAVAVGTALGSTEMWSNLAHRIPSLGPLGFLAAAILVTVATARHKLLEGDSAHVAAGSFVALAAFAAVAWLALFELAADRPWAAAAGGLLLAACAALAARQIAAAGAERRARLVQLATLGRFSAQLAHDLRNPLAALRGAAQFLETELRPDPSKRDLALLLVEQCDRLQRTLEAYQRLAQIEAVRQPLEVNEVVRQVISLQPFVSDRVSLKTELAQGLPSCRADRELLASAVENLVKNAFEAIDGKGQVTVRTGLEERGVVVHVEDDGAGMDARRRARAFEEFFTTKAGGSGLGLSFVRRVAEAHGGDVTLRSEEGRGTVVKLRLPLG
jgi:signal transduction histidine kinase